MANETTLKQEIENIAKQIVMAAVTAPKGRGVETLSYMILNQDDKTLLAKRMDEIAKGSQDLAFFARDAENIRQCATVILIGTNHTVRGINCGYCGYAMCSQKPLNQPCVFNNIDLGIAIGSAASKAMDMRVDNRIMYSAGKAALELPFFKEKMASIFAIPLSCSAKNIFFDRKTV